MKEAVGRHQVMWISTMISGGGQVGVMRCFAGTPGDETVAETPEDEEHEVAAEAPEDQE